MKKNKVLKIVLIVLGTLVALLAAAVLGVLLYLRSMAASLPETLPDAPADSTQFTLTDDDLDKLLSGEITLEGLTRERDYRDVDGLITDEPGLVLSTFYADCVPLYVVDPVHRAIGMSHSGWRGTAARMGAVTLSAMQEAYGTRPEDVVCAVGPSICKDCYEVSADVADIFAEEFPGHEQEILAESEKNSVGMAHADKKYQLDLWKANEIIFQEAGVRKEHLAVTDICTCCNPKLLFSHRASHGKRGNLGGFLYLK